MDNLEDASFKVTMGQMRPSYKLNNGIYNIAFTCNVLHPSIVGNYTLPIMTVLPVGAWKNDDTEVKFK